MSLIVWYLYAHGNPNYYWDPDGREAVVGLPVPSGNGGQVARPGGWAANDPVNRIAKQAAKQGGKRGIALLGPVGLGAAIGIAIGDGIDSAKNINESITQLAANNKFASHQAALKEMKDCQCTKPHLVGAELDQRDAEQSIKIYTGVVSCRGDKTITLICWIQRLRRAGLSQV